MSDSLNELRDDFLIIGADGQVGRDIQTYFTAQDISFSISQKKLLCKQDVINCLRQHPDHKVINLAFDKSLTNNFTNIELPILLDNMSKLSPIYLSSNAVYGLAERCVRATDSVVGFNDYARQKIEVEKNLKRSTIIRGSFLSSHHRLFSAINPKINQNSIWNGITVLELARLIVKDSFHVGIQNFYSMELLDWGDIANFFGKSFKHTPNFLENQCILISDLEEVRSLIKQFKCLNMILTQ